MSFNIKNRRYLGSKAKLLDFIYETVKDNCSTISSFADIFGGTGNVAWKFNDKDTKIIINDMLYSNYVVYEAFFGKDSFNLDTIEKNIDKYNNSDVNELEDNYFSINFADTFFSYENCKKIGYIREDIEQLYNFKQINQREKSILITSLLYSIDRIANTVGHYDAFRANGDLSKKLYLEKLEIPTNDINMNNEFYCMDSNELVKQINADLVYIDPPYNSRQYCDAYHLLENVATWKKPEVFGTAKKMDRQKIKSKYCLSSAPKVFDDLINNINSKYILVSYNNMGNKGAGRSQAKISDADIITILSKKGKVKIFETDFQQFTTGKSLIEDHKERLFLCIVGEGKDTITIEKEEGLIKSPLNYTGGKFKLMPQLLEKFPKNFDTFVDLFGGGFNVGVNVDSKSVVYNDCNCYISKIIKLFSKYSSYEIIDKIDKIILEYNLSSTFEHGYEFYKCDSNKGVGSYNKIHYEELRNKFNSFQKENDEKYFMLLTLIIFSFNNQIRFNSKGMFNMPVGKRDFNSNTRKNIKRFSNKIKSLNVRFYNKDFEEINISKLDNPFVYCDPPYYLGTASYNESEGWTENDEKRLLSYLKQLNDKNIKFALSNVIEHKGMTHELLKEWVDENHFNLIYVKSNYNNSNYQIKNKNGITREVLITNY